MILRNKLPVSGRETLSHLPLFYPLVKGYFWCMKPIILIILSILTFSSTQAQDSAQYDIQVIHIKTPYDQKVELCDEGSYKVIWLFTITIGPANLRELEINQDSFKTIKNYSAEDSIKVYEANTDSGTYTLIIAKNKERVLISIEHDNIQQDLCIKRKLNQHFEFLSLKHDEDIITINGYWNYGLGNQGCSIRFFIKKGMADIILADN